MKPKNEKYTVAVDFDGVLHMYASPWVNHHTIPDGPVPGAIQWLNEMCASFKVVIFTTRGKTWRGRRAVLQWLWKHGATSPKDAETWSDLDFVVTDRKPPALVYLDDRAMRFAGVFPAADDIHRARPWNKP